MSETAVRAHLAAFNAHDTDALLAGLAPEVVWATGADVVRGRAALLDLFDPGLWAMAPSLAVVTLVASGPYAAAELVEDITVGGERLSFPIAVFLTVVDGLITRVKVFREGSADLPSEPAGADSA